MKANKILLVLALILGSIYFILDRQLFYYGKNDFNLYHMLPLKIKPKFRPVFEDGFALMDNFGFTIAAKGNTYKYEGKDIIVNEVHEYYYNVDKVIAQIIDGNNEKYYIEFLDNKENLTKQDISVNVWSNEKIINYKEFKHISIKGNEKHIKIIELARNYTMFIFIVLFLVLIFKTIILFRSKI